LPNILSYTTSARGDPGTVVIIDLLRTPPIFGVVDDA